jgi:hypothetical protein
MKGEITELEIDRVSSPRDLIDSCIESSAWGVEGKPSVWSSIISLLDEVDKKNGNWTKGEHNSVKRFLRDFAKEVFVIEELPQYQRVTVNWLMSNGGEDIGQSTEEEIELVNKWVDKLCMANL